MTSLMTTRSFFSKFRSGNRLCSNLRMDFCFKPHQHRFINDQNIEKSCATLTPPPNGLETQNFYEMFFVRFSTFIFSRRNCTSYIRQLMNEIITYRFKVSIPESLIKIVKIPTSGINWLGKSIIADCLLKVV